MMTPWHSATSARQPLEAIEPRRICLIKPSALGDVVQSLPVLTALRQRYPTAHIAWVINRGYAELLDGHPHLDEVIPFDRGGKRPWSPAAWRTMSELCRLLQSRRFDLVCDLQGLLRSACMSRATRAERRIGLSDAREGSRYFYTDIVPVLEENMSAVDRYWLMADALGAGAVAKQFIVPAAPEHQQWAAEQLGSTQALWVAIHPGGRWVTKRWPAEHFAEVAKRTSTEFGARVAIVGGPEEAAAASAIQWAAGVPMLNLVGRTNLKQLAAVLGRVQLLITNDSGPMHLAAAVGTPVVGLFTCTSPQRARPYGTGHVVCATRVWCASSYLKRCARMECMAELNPDRVWPAIAARLRFLRSGAVASV